MRWPSPPLVHIAHRTHRLIASRYPTVGIFEELVSPGDAAAALELELLTGDQARPERLLPKEKVVYGVPGATLINAAFVYTSPSGGRFNRPVLGAWYCALALETAIRETVYHHVRRLSCSAAGFHLTVQMRELLSDLDAELHDIRGQREALTELYDPQSYAASQAFAAELRGDGSNGIVYDSVRHEGGTCLAVFEPWLLPPIREGDCYQYSWAGGPKPEIIYLGIAQA